jgi:hypothetical protein
MARARSLLFLLGCLFAPFVIYGALPLLIAKRLGIHRTLAMSQADKHFTNYIIDPAVPAEKPVRPHKALIIALLSTVALLVAVGMILVAAQQLGPRTHGPERVPTIVYRISD